GSGGGGPAGGIAARAAAPRARGAAGAVAGAAGVTGARETTSAPAIDFARHDRIRPIRWTGQSLELLDQRRLPFEVEYLACRSSDEVATAIHALAVRGAPAIGIAAAWGVVLAARDVDATNGDAALAMIEPALQRLNAARPTAVNLAWALARMRRALAGAGGDWRDVLEHEARAIETE